MEEQKQDRRYEILYTQLLERGMELHLNNRKRIKAGLILLLLLPFILGIIRKLTESDKIVFLIIWVFCMFVICIYLITIEYIDDTLKKTLEEVTEREADFGSLIMGNEQMKYKIAMRREWILDRIQARIRAGGENPESEDEE